LLQWRGTSLQPGNVLQVRQGALSVLLPERSGLAIAGPCAFGGPVRRGSLLTGGV